VSFIFAKEIILVKLGEIVLKGLNRRTFEEALKKNIRNALSHLGKFDLSFHQSTINIEPLTGEVDLGSALEVISKIFGIVSFSRAGVCEKDMEAIQNFAPMYLEAPLRSANTFKVESKRADKKFPLKSPEISAVLGERILQEFPHLKVDVHTPDITVTTEIRDRFTYITGDIQKGAGGIPSGTGGKAAILISGGIDSPAAGYMMAKRGMRLCAIHFASPPYTSERAEYKVVKLLSKLAEYSGEIVMYTVPFTKIQESIHGKCMEEFFTIIMRRVMIRISNDIALLDGCMALITGESLGQVASQTINAIVCTDDAANMPIFRPLIGMDKDEIINIARRIGTFETSIEPYEDCCTVFTPKHPKTKPILKFVKQEEKRAELEPLIEEALSNLKITHIHGFDSVSKPWRKTNETI